MKTTAMFVSLAIATLDWTLVQAAECTTDELTSISEIYSSAMSEGTASCPDMATADATTDYCSLTDCLDFMSSMLDDLPDCSSGGVDLKAGLQAALDYCETGTADMSGVLTGSSSMLTADTSSSSESTTDSPSSSSSSSSVFRTQSPSATSSTTDSSSDKVTSDTLAPAMGGSSSASSIGMAISSAAFAVTALMFAVGL